ncbi:unnamed protein product [Vicia faba]|uniref:Uncharacterized protein n=1 Tax=Vicia faba TaxID=3906 RepID=A0AAV1BDE8_VICFA|nr:unnamed protein product [Vicia faba]
MRGGDIIFCKTKNRNGEKDFCFIFYKPHFLSLYHSISIHHIQPTYSLVLPFLSHGQILRWNPSVRCYIQAPNTNPHANASVLFNIKTTYRPPSSSLIPTSHYLFSTRTILRSPFILRPSFLCSAHRPNEQPPINFISTSQPLSTAHQLRRCPPTFEAVIPVLAAPYLCSTIISIF